MTQPVGTRIPDPRPAKFVQVLKSGGTAGNAPMLGWRTLTFDTWDTLESAAAETGELVYGLVNSLPWQELDDAVIYRVQTFAAPANVPDQLSGQPRYRFSASLLFRGSAL